MQQVVMVQELEEQGEAVLEHLPMDLAMVVQVAEVALRQVVVLLLARIAQHVVWAVEGEVGQAPCLTWAVGRVHTSRRPLISMWEPEVILM